MEELIIMPDLIV